MSGYWPLLVAALLFGNMVGDQLTLKDCASKGEAKMFGGGSITCKAVTE